MNTNKMFKSCLSSEQSNIIVTKLVSIFTKKQTQELQELAHKLTPEIVETTLKTFKNWRIAHGFFNWASMQPGYSHNCYVFNTMAGVLQGARQNAAMKVLVKDVVKSRCEMTPGALGFLMRCLGGRGLGNEASWVFDQVKAEGLCVPNGYSYNCLLEALSKSSSTDEVERRLREMQSMGWKPDKFTLTPVLRSYCNAGNFEKVMEIFNKMKEEGWMDDHVVSILAVAFSKWGEVDKAMELIKRMEGYNIFLNEKTLFVLVHGFVRENRVDKALILYDKIQRMGYTPDLPVFDVLIEGLCKNKEVEKALCLYYEMKELGIRPDVALLRKLVFHSPIEKDMIKLLDEWEDDLGSEAVTLLFNSVLQNFIECGSIDRACHLLQGMIGDESRAELKVGPLSKVLPNTNSFEIVIDGLCKGDKLDMALELFHDMDRLNCSRSVLLYNNLIYSLSCCDRAEECNNLLKEMKECGFQPTQFTYNSVFGCFCNRGDDIEALSVAKEMRGNGYEPWIKHITMLVKKLSEDGKATEASKFLDSLVLEGFLPGIVPYSAAIDGFLKIHQIDNALKLFRDIESRGYCADVVAYNIIINGLFKAKRISEAHNIMNNMLEKGLIPSVVTYNSLIDGWCKIGDIDRAMLCFSSMVGKQREPNVVSCTTLIDGLCNIGRANDAIRIWKEMREKGCAPNKISYMALIRGLCKCKMADTALVFFSEMEEMGFKADVYIYIALIDTLIFSSKQQLAFDVLKMMIKNRLFPDSADKNYSTLRHAILKLSEEIEVASNINILLAEANIPNISSILDFGNESPAGR